MAQVAGCPGRSRYDEWYGIPSSKASGPQNRSEGFIGWKEGSDMDETIMNPEWWKAAGMRALKTMCQTAIATIGSSAVIQEVNWPMVASATALSGILSLLTSGAGLPELKQAEEIKQLEEAK